MIAKMKIFSSTVILTSLISFTADIKAETLNVEKYKKAELQLSKFTDKQITGTVDYPHWSNNEQLLYRSSTEQGKQFFVLDAKTKQKKLAFDHQKLSAALARITEKEVNQENLPFKSFEIVSKNKISLKVKGKAYQCNIESYLCKLTKNAAKKNELVAPNGEQAVFIREHNLWLRNLNDNSEKQLTSDGIENFAYATNNAGWIRGKKPVVKWSPDSKKLSYI